MENPSPLLAALPRVVTATWACLAGAQALPAAAVLERGKVQMDGIDQARDDRGRVLRDKGLSGGWCSTSRRSAPSRPTSGPSAA